MMEVSSKTVHPDLDFVCGSMTNEIYKNIITSENSFDRTYIFDSLKKASDILSQEMPQKELTKLTRFSTIRSSNMLISFSDVFWDKYLYCEISYQHDFFYRLGHNISNENPYQPLVIMNFLFIYEENKQIKKVYSMRTHG